MDDSYGMEINWFLVVMCAGFSAIGFWGAIRYDSLLFFLPASYILYMTIVFIKILVTSEEKDPECGDDDHVNTKYGI